MLEHLRDVIAGGHRALVFSQFTGFLAHVRDRLDAAGVRYCYLDGKTQARKAELFARVIDEGNVFGASLDADDIRALFA